MRPQGWAAIALELTPGISAADALELSERFEPILYFHAEEKFLPANAKRYIEKCALWKAESPFDAKDFCGGKGPAPYPYPRAPIIDNESIIGDQGRARHVPGEQSSQHRIGRTVP